MTIELALTRSLLEDMDPASWERMAAFLDGLLSREPLHSGSAWERERVVMGALMTELREASRLAGEPESAAILIRAPGVAGAERAATERAVAGRVASLRAEAAPEIEERALAIMRAERERFGELDRELEALRVQAEPASVVEAPELPAWA